MLTIHYTIAASAPIHVAETRAARQDTAMIPLLVASLSACLVNIALVGASR